MNKLPEKEHLKKFQNLQDFLSLGNITHINRKHLYSEIVHVINITHDNDESYQGVTPIKVLQKINAHD